MKLFEPIRARVTANLKQRRLLQEYLDPAIIKWAARIRAGTYLPGFLENVFVSGYEHLPAREDPAPIIAFSHKKAHDVWTLVEFFVGRPVENFHDVTAIIQAGVHSGIYPWRDLFPGFLKHRVLRWPAVAAANFLGNRLASIFRAVHTRPVFREGLDVPVSAEEYEREMAAGHLLGMDYADFQRFANRTTMQSVVQVQKEMTRSNASLVIAPEGRYRLDGAVAEIQDLLGVVAYRKERACHLVSLAYDELCPDRLGRIDAFLFVSPRVDPPALKFRIGAYLKRARETLQKNTPVTASHLLAGWLLERHRAGLAFTREDLLRGLQDLSAQVLDAATPVDQRLADESFRQERVARFWKKYARRWLDRSGPAFIVNAERINIYATGERTVNDLEWNRNHTLHLGLRYLSGK